MITVSNVHRELDRPLQPTSYKSIGAAEEEMVSAGSDTSRLLFGVVRLISAATHGEGAGIWSFNSILEKAQTKNVVVAADSDEPEELKGAAIFTYPHDRDGHRAWLDHIAVLPRLRHTKQYYGSALLTHVERDVHLAGGKKLYLATADDSATAFYAALGYKNDELMTMSKVLDSREQ